MFIGGIPIVSLDSVYLEPDGEDILFLDCTRLNGTKDLVSRVVPDDKYFVDKQIEELSKKIKMNNGNEIILADDVVFSGTVIRSVIEKFKTNGINVLGVRCSVSTKEGYNYFNQNLSLGLKCGCLMGEDVIDQICERDFYFGVAQSGISVLENKEVLKAPYFSPYGNPVERASIPKEYEEYFSKGCIVRSLALWDRITKLSGREILVRELPEKIKGTEYEDVVTESLKSQLKLNKIKKIEMNR